MPTTPPNSRHGNTPRTSPSRRWQSPSPSKAAAYAISRRLPYWWAVGVAFVFGVLFGTTLQQVDQASSHVRKHVHSNDVTIDVAGGTETNASTITYHSEKNPEEDVLSVGPQQEQPAAASQHSIHIHHNPSQSNHHNSKDTALHELNHSNTTTNLDSHREREPLEAQNNPHTIENNNNNNNNIPHNASQSYHNSSDTTSQNSNHSNAATNLDSHYSQPQQKPAAGQQEPPKAPIDPHNNNNNNNTASNTTNTTTTTTTATTATATKQSSDADVVASCNLDSATTPGMPPPPLSFVHIPKTGGSSIEEAARDAGKSAVKWGYFLWTSKPSGKKAASKGRYLWHMPPSILPSLYDHYSNYWNSTGSLPYDGHELFGVIRNPYARIISEAFYNCGLVGGAEAATKCKQRDNVNTALRRSLRQKLNCTGVIDDCYVRDSHYIPQWHYFYNSTTGARTTRYLVHFENLAGDFGDLMEDHAIDIRLPEKRKRATEYATNQTDTAASQKFRGVRDLWTENKRMIEELYRLDFELGGYPMEVDDLESYDAAFSTSPSLANHIQMQKKKDSYWELPCEFDLATAQQQRHRHHRRRHRRRRRR